MEDKLQNNLPEAEIDTTDDGQADTNVVDTQIEAQADTNNDGLVSPEERFAFETRTDDQETFPEGPMGMAYRSEESIAKNIPNYKQYKWYQSPMEEGHEGTEYFYTLGEKIEDFIEQNPEEAADVLEGDLKKEAEQLTDDDKRNDEVNNEVVKKAIGSSFLPDIPTKEVSQQEYNDMSIEDLEKADAEAMKGQGDYITVANDLGLDENDLYYFEDPSFVNELTEEQKEEIKNEPDKEKKIGLLDKIKEAISSFSTRESELDINTGDAANSENASTPLTSGVSPISPSFTSGSSGAGIDVSNDVGNIENKVETKDSKAHSTSANEIDVAEKEQNDGSMNSANQNEHLDDTFDNLSFDETKHNEEVKSNEQFELDGTEGHTSDSNEGIQLPELNSAEDVKKAIIDDSKNWNSENSGSRFLPFKFTVIGDEVIVSQIGTARKEDFDLFAKDEPGSVNQIKAALSNK